jgi:hypothetical protein
MPTASLVGEMLVSVGGIIVKEMVLLATPFWPT